MEFSKIILIFFLAINSLAFASGKSRKFDDSIKEMLDHFEQLTSATTDIPTKFQTLSQQAAPFAKLLGPVGSLVALGFKRVFKPGSDEYKAMSRLHAMALEKLSKIERIVELDIHEQMVYRILVDYDNKVSMSIRTIERYYQKITDPDSNHRRVFKESFVHECRHGDTPREALIWLRRVVHDNCPMPTHRQAINHARLQGIFHAMKGRQTRVEYFEQYKLKLFENLGMLPAHNGTRMLDRLDYLLQWGLNGVEYPIGIFRQILLEFAVEKNSYCLLDVVAEMRGWKRQALYDLVDAIRQQMFKLSIIQAACIGSQDENPVQVQSAFDELTAILLQTTTKIAHWLPAKLQKTWPTITASTAKSTISSDVLNTDPLAINKTAQAVRSAIDLLGPQEYVHSVLLTDASSYSYDEQYRFNCENATCIFLQTEKVNIIIYRYETAGLSARVDRANEWFESNWYRVQTLISRLFDPEENMDALFHKVQEAQPNITTPRLFFNALLLRRRKPWLFPEIIVGQGVAHIDGLVPLRNISYFSENNPIFYHLELYLHL